MRRILAGAAIAAFIMVALAPSAFANPPEGFDACTEDGWAGSLYAADGSELTFKNQGQCVKYVVQGGEFAVDSDGDGVVDPLDAFPDDPSESADGDDDGVGDNSDLCPDEGGDVGPDGCPVDNDSDGDGVPDSEDQCPGLDDTLDVDRNGVPDCLQTSRIITLLNNVGCDITVSISGLEDDIFVAYPGQETVEVEFGVHTFVWDGDCIDERSEDFNVQINFPGINFGS